jgi:ribonuclease-3
MDMKRREDLRDLEETIGYLFEDVSLLDEALSHKSFANEAGPDRPHNERLEFLGDAVISVAVSDLLYHLRPALTEGEMSRVRAYLVKEESLEQIARSFNVGRYLRLGRGEEQTGGRRKSSIVADAFEALVAAHPASANAWLNYGFAYVDKIPAAGAISQAEFDSIKAKALA